MLGLHIDCMRSASTPDICLLCSVQCQADGAVIVKGKNSSDVKGMLWGDFSLEVQLPSPVRPDTLHHRVYDASFLHIQVLE